MQLPGLSGLVHLQALASARLPGPERRAWREVADLDPLHHEGQQGQRGRAGPPQVHHRVLSLPGQAARQQGIIDYGLGGPQSPPERIDVMDRRLLFAASDAHFARTRHTSLVIGANFVECAVCKRHAHLYGHDGQLVLYEHGPDGIPHRIEPNEF